MGKSRISVLKQVKLNYAKANLEDRLIADDSAKKKIIRYVKKDNLIRKSKSTLRKTKKYKQLLKQHEEFFNKTFIIITPDALSKPFQFEDRKFLISMMEDRSATIGSIDRLNLEKVKQRQQKNDKLVQRKSAEMSSKKTLFKTASSSTTLCSSAASDRDCVKSDDDAPTCSRSSHKRQVKTGALLEVPCDILSRNSVTEVMTRCGITPASASLFLQSIILKSIYPGKEDTSNSQLLSKFSLSYSSCDRFKRRNNYSMAEIITYIETPSLFLNFKTNTKKLKSSQLWFQVV